MSCRAKPRRNVRGHFETDKEINDAILEQRNMRKSVDWNHFGDNWYNQRITIFQRKQGHGDSEFFVSHPWTLRAVKRLNAVHILKLSDDVSNVFS